MKHFFFASVLMHVTFSSGRVAEKRSARKLIVNGAPVNQYVPWQVLANGCGGTIISKNLVLTAGHCAQAFKPGESISVGIINKKLGGVQKVQVASFVRHPHYVEVFRDLPNNDVAIVQVAPDFNFSDPAAISPAYLSFKRPEMGSAARVTGFGRYEASQFWGQNTPPSSVLREMSGNIVSCSRQHRSTRYSCIKGNARTGVCSGDSGGPATQHICGKPVVIGVVSGGDETCHPMSPGIFADVHFHLKFIEETWKRLSPDTYQPAKVVDDNGNCIKVTSTTTTTTGVTSETIRAGATPWALVIILIAINFALGGLLCVTCVAYQQVVRSQRVTNKKSTSPPLAQENQKGLPHPQCKDLVALNNPPAQSALQAQPAAPSSRSMQTSLSNQRQQPLSLCSANTHAADSSSRRMQTSLRKRPAELSSRRTQTSLEGQPPLSNRQTQLVSPTGQQSQRSCAQLQPQLQHSVKTQPAASSSRRLGGQLPLSSRQTQLVSPTGQQSQRSCAQLRPQSLRSVKTQPAESRSRRLEGQPPLSSRDTQLVSRTDQQSQRSRAQLQSLRSVKTQPAKSSSQRREGQPPRQSQRSAQLQSQHEIKTHSAPRYQRYVGLAALSDRQMQPAAVSAPTQSLSQFPKEPLRTAQRKPERYASTLGYQRKCQPEIRSRRIQSAQGDRPRLPSTPSSQGEKLSTRCEPKAGQRN